MKKAFYIATTFGAVLLAGCAKNPEDIAGSAVSTAQFSNLSCDQLAARGATLEADLMAASEKQRAAQKKDAVGVLLFGVPAASVSGGNATDLIADLKGQQAAISQVSAQQGCS